MIFRTGRYAQGPVPPIDDLEGFPRRPRVILPRRSRSIVQRLTPMRRANRLGHGGLPERLSSADKDPAPDRGRLDAGGRSLICASKCTDSSAPVAGGLHTGPPGVVPAVGARKWMRPRAHPPRRRVVPPVCVHRACWTVNASPMFESPRKAGEYSTQQTSFFIALLTECHFTCPSANSQFVPLRFGSAPP